MQISNEHGKRRIIRKALKQLADVGYPKRPFKACFDLAQTLLKGQDRSLELFALDRRKSSLELLHTDSADAHDFKPVRFAAGYSN